MVQIFAFLLGDIKTNQIFQRIFMLTLCCAIYSKPLERNTTDRLSSDLTTDNSWDIDKQRIISEIKSKIISRLKLDFLPHPKQTFNWNEIPAEMKELFNKEVQIDENDVDYDEDKLETTVTPLFRSNTCRHNVSALTECFNLTLTDFDSSEIVRVRLMAPVKPGVDVENIKYNITINKSYQIYDLQVSGNGKENVEIDILDTFKEMLYNGFGNSHRENGTLFLVTFDGSTNNVPISHIIDANKMVIEIQYKRPAVLQRSKRRTNECLQHQYFCCAQKIKVDIKELKFMEYIIAPQTFNINYCKGDCNNYVDYSSNHAKAINIIRKQDPVNRKETRSCCVPYSFSSLNIMHYMPDQTVRVTTFTDLSASHCGCL